MDFAQDERTRHLCAELSQFMDDHIYPAETSTDDVFAVKETLKAEARARGLWNLFLPDMQWGAGLTNLQYAPLAELTGRSPALAPEALNCSAPDTGNMQLLATYGTPAQQNRWLRPLLDGTIRSCFSMTEPGVASSDANNISTRIARRGGDYVITGRKWWSTGALHPHCELAIVVGVTDSDKGSRARHSVVLVPRDAPGLRAVRSTDVFGFDHHDIGGHAELIFDEVRVPAQNLVGAPGQGLAVVQSRLGYGRMHHCMRLLGAGERALDMLCRRARERTTFGVRIADHGTVQDWISDARIGLDQARLLLLRAAWLMDTVGPKDARVEISAVKAVIPDLVQRIVDRAIQVHGAEGVSRDVPLTALFAEARYLRIGDGPDEVHRRAVAQRELKLLD